MAVIDADCHVIEPDEVWDYFDESEMRFKPLLLVPENGNGSRRRYMSIDGRLRSAGSNDETTDRRGSSVAVARQEMAGFTRTTEAMRTMRDVEGRLRHMDELGVDIQVLFPTSMALGQITNRPDTETALCRSYNRWAADVCSKSNGRLRWIATPPLLNIEESVQQIRWSAANGACGIRVRGFEGDRLSNDPYFFPVYEECERQNIPVTFHAGNANPAYNSLVAGSAWASNKVPVMSAFQNLMYNEVPAKFPSLRWGFIEAAASWVPYMLIDLERRMIRDGRTPLGENPMKDHRFYVACQTNDDLPYVIKWAGEDNLVIGSDYGHADSSSELEALKNLESITGLPHHQVKKILEDNPAALYGL
jgi:predicted TIM-barrel fold metal-dependent hydrolase